MAAASPIGAVLEFFAWVTNDRAQRNGRSRPASTLTKLAGCRNPLHTQGGRRDRKLLEIRDFFQRLPKNVSEFFTCWVEGESQPFISDWTAAAFRSGVKIATLIGWKSEDDGCRAVAMRLESCLPAWVVTMTGDDIR